MNTLIRCLFLCSLLAFTVSTAHAEENANPSVLGSWARSGFNWVEAQRDALSSQVTRTGRAMDEYIARDMFDKSQVNESYLRVQVSQDYSSGYDNDFEVKVRANVDVPNAKERINLFLDSDPDEFDSVFDRRHGSEGDTAEKSTVVGISFWRNVEQSWNPSLSVGASTSPFELIGRIKLFRHFELSELWQLRVADSLTHQDSKGWVNSTQFDFYRPLSENIFLNIATEAQYFQRRGDAYTGPLQLPDKDYYELFHGWYYTHQLADRKSIQYSVAATAINRPNVRLQNAWFRIDWRKLVHEDWLFFKVSPEVSFPRDRDFKATYAITFGIEMYVGENFSADQPNGAPAGNP